MVVIQIQTHPCSYGPSSGGPSTSGGFPPPSKPYPAYPPWMWSPPPWLNQNSFLPSPPVTGDNPYKACFKGGNISVCNGCHNNFSQVDNIVLQHEEFRHYTNPQSGLPASKFGNVHYHPNRSCIELKMGVQFDARSLVIADCIKEQFTAHQKQYLSQEFGLPM